MRLKHSANRCVVQGKRIVLIDDSIVRGTTSVKIVQMMRDAGAKEVHFRISSPPITHPDYYGIDTPQQNKLLAAQMTKNGKIDIEGMCKYVGADSLAFLSLTASIAPWVTRDATRSALSSPTIVSPAIIRRRSRISPATRTATSCPAGRSGLSIALRRDAV